MSLADLDSAIAALGLLASGRFERVRTALRDGLTSPALPLIAARYTAWTGDLRTIAGIWDAARSTALQLLDQHGAADDASLLLRLATFTELERTATDLGDPALAARLVASARRELAACEQRTLPPDLAATAALLGLAPLLPADGFPDRSLDAAGDSDAAARLTFVHGRLGAEPDGARQRLRLRPRLTGAMTGLTAELRFADGSVSLHVTCAPGETTCTVTQEAGAIPFTLLLEPVIHGAFSSARVDGAPADLSPRPVPGGTMVPVQLVLDSTRTLLIATTG